MKQVLWWICLLAAPLVLITIELFHPANFTVTPGMYEFLSHAEHYDPTYQALGYFGPEWWFALHMIQTPMVGLVAVGLWLMVDDVGGADGGAAMVCAGFRARGHLRLRGLLRCSTRSAGSVSAARLSSSRA
jgi:hypothetical protein